MWGRSAPGSENLASCSFPLFGTPNNSLQAVSDVVDKHFKGAVSRLSANLDIELKTIPGCAYKIIDLFGIAGEADTFPKHFAYFMPEDQGIKYSPNKRTVVFANTYLALYQHIADEQKISLVGPILIFPVAQRSGATSLAGSAATISAIPSSQKQPTIDS